MGVISCSAGGNSYHYPPALIGISYWNDWIFVSLGERSTCEAACALQMHLQPPSHTSSSHGTVSACALTLSLSTIHHPELKIQGLVSIILLPWWPGWLSCPSAHGRMLQTFTSVQARRIVLCFPPHNSEPPLCRSCWCCTMQLSINHQVFRENQRVRICMDRSSCMETCSPK